MLLRQFLLGVIMTFTGVAAAQEMEPRAYSPSPVGLNFLIFSYAHQNGDFLFGPTLPIEDAQASLNSSVAAYGRTFGITGRSANVLVALPYVWGTASGRVFEEQSNITRSGLADMRLRFAMNILGGPALKPQAFAARKPATTLGASLLAIAPTGQYDPAKLINIGSNRWSFKPEVGLSHPIGHWYLELYGGVWLFTDNHNFFGGSRRKQKPIAAIQAHVSYTIRPRFWLAANATYYTGGRTIIDETIRADLQRNTRIGVALSLPVSRRYSAKIAWARGVKTRFGGDFNSVAISWQYAWID
ncbi:MAG: transporter [Acidobacteria bacterium]|nr:transporter [Acidobacteriota bacterium]